MGDFGNSGVPPEGCDCCGRDAEDCDMEAHGWLVRDAPSDFPGVYCIGCASLLRLVLWSEECTECTVLAESESAAERDGWRYFADELGQLVPFCPACAAAVLAIAPSTASGSAEPPRRVGDEAS
jgi:hypothetical protein